MRPRQLGQALTNIVKNAVEAIEPKPEPADGQPRGHISMQVAQVARGSGHHRAR
jgi:two-component system nitrogen regulation sensor histidine kinase NtrY